MKKYILKMATNWVGTNREIELGTFESEEEMREEWSDENLLDAIIEEIGLEYYVKEEDA